MRTKPPTPTEILKLTGGYRPDRHGDRLELPPSEALPPPPTWMTDSAKELYRMHGAQLMERGLMCDLYATALALLASTHDEYLRLSQACEAEPMTVTTSGGIAIHPLRKAKNTAWNQLLKVSREFGMSPSSVAGVSPTKGSAAGNLPTRSRYFKPKLADFQLNTETKPETA